MVRPYPFGQATLPVVELLSALAAVAGLAVITYGHRWGWWVATVASLGYAYFCWHNHLAGLTAVNLVYALTQFWGGMRWGERACFVSVPRARWSWLAILPLAWLLQTWLRPADAWLSAASLVNQGLTSAGVWQSWRAWVLIDLATAAFFASLRAWPSVALFVIFAGLAEQAHRRWSTRRGADESAGQSGGSSHST